MGNTGEDRVPESWIGKTVVLEVRGRKRGSYLVLGRLSEATAEGIGLINTSSERVAFYPRERVVDVRLGREA